MSTQTAGSNRNTIIIVVVIVLLCCCCLAIAGGLYAYKDVLLKMINGATPTTRALLNLVS